MADRKQKMRSEQELPAAIDKCIADGLIKTGTGLAAGGVLSIFLFRRKMWPVTLGLGIGIGMALANCETNLNSTCVVQKEK